MVEGQTKKTICIWVLKAICRSLQQQARNLYHMDDPDVVFENHQLKQQHYCDHFIKHATILISFTHTINIERALIYLISCNFPKPAFFINVWENFLNDSWQQLEQQHEWVWKAGKDQWEASSCISLRAWKPLSPIEINSDLDTNIYFVSLWNLFVKIAFNILLISTLG